MSSGVVMISDYMVLVLCRMGYQDASQTYMP